MAFLLIPNKLLGQDEHEWFSIHLPTPHGQEPVVMSAFSDDPGESEGT